MSPAQERPERSFAGNSLQCVLAAGAAQDDRSLWTPVCHPAAWGSRNSGAARQGRCDQVNPLEPIRFRNALMMLELNRRIQI
jgi:hypothetical protein